MQPSVHPILGRGQTFTERSAQRIFHAADLILKAGYAQDSTVEAP